MNTGEHCTVWGNNQTHCDMLSLDARSSKLVHVVLWMFNLTSGPATGQCHLPSLRASYWMQDDLWGPHSSVARDPGEMVVELPCFSLIFCLLRQVSYSL